MLTNGGQDQLTLKVLYKFFAKGLIVSDDFFENFVDRLEFFNKIILEPLISIGKNLRSTTSDNQGDVLKKARNLLTIVLTWIAKTALIRNSHVFTLNVLDNDCLVTLIQTFSSFEIDQYLSLFERFSRSAKALSLNLQIYSMFCKLLRMLVNCMSHYFELPRNEIKDSRVF